MKPFTLSQIAELTGSQLFGNPSFQIDGVAGLESATPTDVSFLGNLRYLPLMADTKAGAVFVTPDYPRDQDKQYLVNESPSKAFQTIVELIHRREEKASGFSGIHPTAVIHPSVKIGQQVTVSPYAVIDEGVAVGERTFIGPHVSIGRNVTLGADCVLHPHVTVRDGCLIGNRVILQPGAVIGSCGFGYTMDEKGRHIKLNQVGIVVIEDDVEIGANTTIDRARFEKTVIGHGTKIDNLVQIGHNVVIGHDNIIVSQTGIAGSSETGHHVVLGGKVAVNGHIKITDYVMVSACSGVSKTITKAGKYGGLPVMPLNEHNKQTVLIRQIEKHLKRIEELEKRLDALSDKG